MPNDACQLHGGALKSRRGAKKQSVRRLGITRGCSGRGLEDRTGSFMRRKTGRGFVVHLPGIVHENEQACRRIGVSSNMQEDIVPDEVANDTLLSMAARIGCLAFAFAFAHRRSQTAKYRDRRRVSAVLDASTASWPPQYCCYFCSLPFFFSSPAVGSIQTPDDQAMTPTYKRLKTVDGLSPFHRWYSRPLVDSETYSCRRHLFPIHAVNGIRSQCCGTKLQISRSS